MKKNRFQFLSIILSYFVFVFVIIVSINAVVPEKDLQVLEPKEILVKKVDNNFLRNKNSVYEILEKDNREPEKSIGSEKEQSPTKIKKTYDNIILNNLNLFLFILHILWTFNF